MTEGIMPINELIIALRERRVKIDSWKLRPLNELPNYLALDEDGEPYTDVVIRELENTIEAIDMHLETLDEVMEHLTCYSFGALFDLMISLKLPEGEEK